MSVIYVVVIQVITKPIVWMSTSGLEFILQTQKKGTNIDNFPNEYNLYSNLNEMRK